MEHFETIPLDTELLFRKRSGFHFHILHPQLVNTLQKMCRKRFSTNNPLSLIELILSLHHILLFDALRSILLDITEVLEMLGSMHLHMITFLSSPTGS